MHNLMIHTGALREGAKGQFALVLRIYIGSINIVNCMIRGPQFFFFAPGPQVRSYLLAPLAMRIYC